MVKAAATVTTKGQLTLPRKLRQAMDINAGDRITFDSLDGEKGHFSISHRRSIFELLKTMPPLSAGEPLTQTDINAAIDEAIDAKFARWKKREA